MEVKGKSSKRIESQHFVPVLKSGLSGLLEICFSFS